MAHNDEQIFVPILEQAFTEKQYVDKDTVETNSIKEVNILPSRQTNSDWTWLDNDTIGDTKVEFYDKDPITGNYKLSLVKEYEFLLDLAEGNKQNNILEGYLLVPVELDGKNQIYLRDISIPINLDLNLFGTNTLELSSWGFKASEYFEEGLDLKTTVTIRYNLNSYFSDDVLWKDLKLWYKDLTIPNGTFTDKDLNSLGGLTELELVARHVYEVKIEYTVDYLDTTPDETRKILNLWILSTPLFNDCFNIGNEKYINNYCNPQGKELEIFNSITQINFYIEGELGITQGVENAPVKNGFKPFYTDSSIVFDIKLIKTYNVNYNNLSVKVKDSELYPTNIVTSIENKVNNILLEPSINSINVKNLDGYISNWSNSDLSNLNINYNLTIKINENNNNLINVEYYDFLQGQANEVSEFKDVPFVFHTISENIIEEWPYTNKGIFEIRYTPNLYSSSYIYTTLTVNSNYASDPGLCDIFQYPDTYKNNEYNFFVDNNAYDYKLRPSGLREWRYVFMYIDNVDHYLLGSGSENNFANEGNFANVKYKDNLGQISEYNIGGDLIPEERNNNDVKFLIYTKTYLDDNDILNIKKYRSQGMDQEDLVRWGIIPGMVDYSSQEMMMNSKTRRELVVNKIKSLFPLSSRLCTKPKENVYFYTIQKTLSNPFTYFTDLRNYKYKYELKIKGSKNLSNESEGVINYDNLNLKFQLNNDCEKIISHEVILNSYNEYHNLLYNLPKLGPYIDVNTGETVTDLVGAENYVYVLENGLFKTVENVKMIYNYDDTVLYPIFKRNENDQTYTYIDSEFPSTTSEQNNTYRLNLNIFNYGGLKFRPYPIYSLTVSNQ